MANGLERIANILKRLNNELQLDNDKWEKANGQSNVLSTSDARIRTVGTGDNGCCGGCEKQNNTKLGE